MRQSLIINKAEVLRVPGLAPRYESLFSRSVSSLTPPIHAAGFNERFEQLDSELKAKGLIHLEIETYFGDEWFCPSQSTAIAIPFWLADERLMKIERN